MSDILKFCNQTVDAVGSNRTKQYFDELFAPLDAYSQVHAILVPVICCIGVLTNVATICVLVQPTMRNPINFILTAIAVCDSLTMGMLFAFYFVLRNSLAFSTFPWAVFTLIYANLTVTAHANSLWLTVVLAAVRHIILKRHQLIPDGILAKLPGILCVIFTTTALVCLACVPNFVRNRILPTNRTAAYSYPIGPPAWWNCTLEKFNFWLAGVTLKIIPCFLLTYFMTLLIMSLLSAKKRKKRLQSDSTPRSHQTTQSTPAVSRHDRTTVLLIVIVFVFLLTELPQGILVLVLALDQSAYYVYRKFGDILDLLSLINSCVNFVIYCSMSEQFRTQFALTFGLNRLKAFVSNHSCSTTTNTENSLESRKREITLAVPTATTNMPKPAAV